MQKNQNKTFYKLQKEALKCELYTHFLNKKFEEISISPIIYLGIFLLL